MDCTRDMFTCAAQKHQPDCPWHPDNVTHTTVSDEVWDQLTRDLEAPAEVVPELAEQLARRSRIMRDPEELTASELSEARKIADKHRRGKVTDPYVLSLHVRYDAARCQLIIKEAVRLIRETPIT